MKNLKGLGSSVLVLALVACSEGKSLSGSAGNTATVPVVASDSAVASNPQPLTQQPKAADLTVGTAFEPILKKASSLQQSSQQQNTRDLTVGTVFEPILKKASPPQQLGTKDLSVGTVFESILKKASSPQQPSQQPKATDSTAGTASRSPFK